MAPRSDASADLLRQAEALEATAHELYAATYSSAARKRLHDGSRDLKRHRRRRDA